MLTTPLHATLAPLRPFRDLIDTRMIVTESRKVWHLIKRSPHWNKIRKQLTHAVNSGNLDAINIDTSLDTLRATLTENANYAALTELCRSLISWRTGPYQIGSLNIDTEWRSFMKWRRIESLIPRQPGMRIADIGCSNGYFLFKLAALQPELALGFDPIERCWLQFALLQSIFQIPRVGFLPMGLLSLEAFPAFFDFILCMGVIYHQRDQALAVKRLFDATRPGGLVIVESLVVPGAEPLVIKSPDRYAKMRNAWTIPSANYIAKLFMEAGFCNVTTHQFGALTTAEQRRAPFAPFQSLADFLDPNDSSRTIEGHPAPHTAAVVGYKGL